MLSPSSVFPPQIALTITNANGNIVYVDICCPETLEELNSIDKETIIIICSNFWNVDVVDNIIIEP